MPEMEQQYHQHTRPQLLVALPAASFLERDTVAVEITDDSRLDYGQFFFSASEHWHDDLVDALEEHDMDVPYARRHWWVAEEDGQKVWVNESTAPWR